MTTVTLSVASRDDVTCCALAAFEGHRQGTCISFSSVELPWRIMTSACWVLLKVMTGQGAMSIHEAEIVKL